MKVAVSVISHRPFKKVTQQYEYLYILSKEYGIPVYVWYQSEEFYNQVPDKFREVINVELNTSATCAGDNLFNSSSTFDKYDYILNMDDDIARFSYVIQKEGKLGYTTNVSKGRSKEEVYATSAEVLHDFIVKGIEKLESDNYAYVTCQAKFFSEWNENPWKDSKSTSSTQLALWKAPLFKEAIDYFRQYEFPRVHGYDQFYRAYIMDKGYKYSCNLHHALYPKNQGVNDSVIRPDGTFGMLSVLDTIYVMRMFPGLFNYRKMATGFVKLTPGEGEVDQYLLDLEEQVLNDEDLKKFTEPYKHDMEIIKENAHK